MVFERASTSRVLASLAVLCSLVLSACGGVRTQGNGVAPSGAGISAGPTPPPKPGPQPNPSITPTPTGTPVSGSVEYLNTFKNLMENYGRLYCKETEIKQALTDATFSEGNVWYYDGALNYHNMAAFTNDSSWLTCADHVAKAYRGWVNSRNLPETPWKDYRALSGWRLFPHGLHKHLLRTGQQEDRDALTRLATKSAFMSDWDAHTVPSAPACGGSREVAYLINVFLVGKDIGIDPGTKLTQSVNWALGHLDQWFVAKTCISSTDSNNMMQPFMVGLTTEALIFAYEKTNDETLRTRIRQKVEIAMDELWTMAWRENSKSMYANTVSPNEMWPVVNVLIGASYSWLWQVTGASRHAERADKLWNGAMTMDFPNQIWSGKQYSQIFRRAFDHIKWRSAPAGSLNPPTRY